MCKKIRSEEIQRSTPFLSETRLTYFSRRSGSMNNTTSKGRCGGSGRRGWVFIGPLPPLRVRTTFSLLKTPVFEQLCPTEDRHPLPFGKDPTHEHHSKGSRTRGVGSHREPQPLLSVQASSRTVHEQLRTTGHDHDRTQKTILSPQSLGQLFLL